MKRKPGQPHKGWKKAVKKYKVSGVWRTGIPQRMRRKAATTALSSTNHSSEAK